MTQTIEQLSARVEELEAENERLSALCDKWNTECDELREDNKRCGNELATAIRQRDLAVDAIRNILHYIDDRNEMRLMDEHVTDDDEANSAIEYNEQLDSAVNQMRTTLSTIKESEAYQATTTNQQGLKPEGSHTA